MLENIEVEKNKSELVEKASSLKAQFKTKEDAIIFYSQALEKICTKNGKSIDEFLKLAESQNKYDDELMEALSFSRKILSLKSMK